MTVADLTTHTQDIAIDEVFPHAAETIWESLTTPEQMVRWMMKPTGFEAIEGNRFTFQTTPAGAWDGTIRCEILEVVRNRRLSYAWKGGDAGNIGYGAPLDTVVTWTLTPVEAGTRIRLVHAGFVTPKNDTAYKNMSAGWAKVVKQLDALTAQSE